jgi:hypothetical protein
MTGKARKTGKVVDSEGIRGKRERRKDGKEKSEAAFSSVRASFAVWSRRISRAKC